MSSSPVVAHLLGGDSDPTLTAGISDLALQDFGPADSIVVCAEGHQPSRRFLYEARDILASDPRIASVSDVDSSVAQLAREGDPRFLAEPVESPAQSILGSAVTGEAVVIKASLFDLVGGPWDSFGDLTIESVLAWSIRGNHKGLRNVWWWSGHDTLRPPLWPVPALEHDEALDSTTATGLLLDKYRAAHCALTVAVDAGWIGPQETGAQVATVHWLDHLAQRPDIAELRLFGLPDLRLPRYAEFLHRHPAIRITREAEGLAKADIYWRPYQPDLATQAPRDRWLGRRLVTTVLDLIEFSNARYQADVDGWRDKRRALRQYLSQVDFITGISNDVLHHLRQEIPGLPLDRLGCTYLGVEHLQGGMRAEPPVDLITRWPEASGSRFVLVLGNDYAHKNRDFAIRVWQILAPDSRIDLVLAGFHVAGSSTKDTEDALLLAKRADGARAIRLEHVSPEARTWLLAHASAVLYPTSAEGFGFVPHEAASLGVPSAFTSFGPLAETLPADSGLVGWTHQEYVQRLRELLDSQGAAEAAADLIRSQDSSLSWDQSTEQLAVFFRSALAKPPRAAVEARPPRPTTSRTNVDLLLANGEDPEVVLAAVTSSLSWRITRPLRRAAAAARRRS